MASDYSGRDYLSSRQFDVVRHTVVGPTAQIRRRRAGNGNERTDAVGACTCIRFLSPFGLVVQSSLMYFGIGKQLLESLNALRGDARVEKLESFQ